MIYPKNIFGSFNIPVVLKEKLWQVHSKGYENLYILYIFKKIVDMKHQSMEEGRKTLNRDKL